MTRLGLVDALRGFALLLMALYHFCFDLEFVGFTRFAVPAAAWAPARIFIVALFTGVAGISLALRNPTYVDRAYLVRLAQILAGALWMSAATYALAPGQWVYFGILHFLFVAGLLGPLMVKAPRACGGLGLVVVLWPTSLTPPLPPLCPPTLDFVPILPWLGVVMLGISFGAWLAQKNFLFARREVPALSFLGRHSLVFYVTHQMALLPIAWLLRKLFP